MVWKKTIDILHNFFMSGKQLRFCQAVNCLRNLSCYELLLKRTTFNKKKPEKTHFPESYYRITFNGHCNFKRRKTCFSTVNH